MISSSIVLTIEYTGSTMNGRMLTDRPRIIPWVV